ncbi:maker715, partial [Drosophila busckii]
QFLDFHNNGEIKPPYDSLKRCQNESTEYNTKVNESKGGETYIESPYPNSCVPFGNSSKQYKINVAGAGSFHVLCDAHTAGPGWITILRRADGKVDFDRDWNAYRNGFGSLNGDFFIGLEKLHYITKSQPYELYVHLKQLNGQTIHARYGEFAISNEKEKYNLIKLDLYSGTAGDYLKTSKHTGFSTKNKVNIQYAKKFNGGWWFNDYTKSNLNGKYVADNNLVGMFWGDLKILNLVKMLIRPKV